MASKLIPSNPSEVMVIRKVTDNITTFSTPFSRFGTIKIGGRGTVVRLASGNLAVFSPTAMTPEVKETVAAMGTVKYLAALDFEHHLFLSSWKKTYPDAKVIGVEGLPEKKKQEGSDLKFDVVFTANNRDTEKIDPEFDQEFDYEYMPGHGNKELVFNYKLGKTLIQGDLMFNLPAVEQYKKTKENPHTGWATKFFTMFNNTSGNALWQRRFIWYMISAGDRPSFNQSVWKIDRWDFDRMIPCHGDVIETDAKNVFREVLGWHLAAVQKQQAPYRK